MKTALFAALLLLLATIAHCDVQRVGINNTKVSLKSTLQACRKDFRRLCLRQPPSAGQVSPVTRRGPINCLQDKIAEIEDDTCKTWVNAEKVCKEAARTNGKCTKTMDLRRCLTQATPQELGKECSESAFYKALSSKRQRPIRKFVKDGVDEKK